MFLPEKHVLQYNTSVPLHVRKYHMHIFVESKTLVESNHSLSISLHMYVCWSLFFPAESVFCKSVHAVSDSITLSQLNQSGSWRINVQSAQSHHGDGPDSKWGNLSFMRQEKLTGMNTFITTHITLALFSHEPYYYLPSDMVFISRHHCSLYYILVLLSILYLHTTLMLTSYTWYSYSQVYLPTKVN